MKTKDPCIEVIIYGETLERLMHFLKIY
jgi:hypothetical protein